MQTRRQALQGIAAAGAAGLAGTVCPAAWAQTLRAQIAGLLRLPALGSALVPPSMTLLDGSTFDAETVKGQVLVVYWWASWCPFCAVVSPEIDKLWRAQRSRGLRVLGLSIDRRAEDASAYLARRGYVFPSAWVTPEVEQRFPKPAGLPVTVAVGRDGKVRMAEAGQLFAEDIEGIARWL